MAVGKGPAWDTKARLNGLPAKNWKTREGVTMDGTFSACVKRWLELAPHHRNDCWIAWGPNAEGQSDTWERANIAAFVKRVGAPPEMGPHVTINHIEQWLAYDRDPAPSSHINSEDMPPGPSVGGDNGAAVWKAWHERRSRVKAPDAQTEDG